ncbi:hypothetical protein JHK82_050143 [Glycine max]|nr:hypothetical protein JHK82_050143 [Glycine max]
MACIPDKIKDINGSKETLKLVVRIADLWFVGTQDKFDLCLYALWKDGDVDLNASPEALSKILGYTLAVKAPCKVHFPLSDANNPPQYETDEKKTYHAAKLEYSISLPSQVYTLLHKTK